VLFGAFPLIARVPIETDDTSPIDHRRILWKYTRGFKLGDCLHRRQAAAQAALDGEPGAS
jgi:hypothetical protein